MYRVFEEYFPIGLTCYIKETTYKIVFFNSATLKLTSLVYFEAMKSKKVNV